MNTSPRRWGLRESAAALVVAAVIAAVGGAAIYAATAGNSHTFGPAHQASGPTGQHGAIGGPVPAAMELHGEYVVTNGAGGYTTELTQTGTVAAISATTISVRSEDGYTQTYVIPTTAGSAGAPFAVDDQVVVRATRTGQTATVTNIGGLPPHRN